MKKYDHSSIEKKWQKAWLKSKTFAASNTSKKKKWYSLIEFPYPSGDGLHVGHVRSNTAMDIISRKRRMEGFNVLYPIGYDAFGLPTENYAIKTGKQPALITKQNTDNFRRQMQAIGFSFDWSREINTTDPKYYKWTQWIFLQMFKQGLAYKKKMTINWCPKDKIGLANEEVVNGCCERCGTPVEKREKEQWMLAITKYADRLDKDLDTVDYLPQIKTQQRNWIGRSEGAEITFGIDPTLALPEGEGLGTDTETGTGAEIKGEYKYHTSDPKTWVALQERAVKMRKNPTNTESILWESLRKNVTGDHIRRQQIIRNFIVDFVCLQKKLVIEIDGDVHDHQKEEDAQRTIFLQEQGFKVIKFTNDEVEKNLQKVINEIIKELSASVSQALPFGEGRGGVAPITVFTTRPDTLFGVTFIAVSAELAQKWLEKGWQPNQKIKNYITNVLADKKVRDFEVKEKTGISCGVDAVNPANGEKVPVWIVNYVLGDVGTGAIMGVPAHDERDFEFATKYKLPIKEIVPGDKDEMTKKYGTPVTTYKLRDWIFSRQRYWGEPIPLIHCDTCGYVAVPDKDLPVGLPKVKNYQPTDNGESPLANIKSWVNVTCPQCKGPATRETDTMPQWAGSSWYYLRYTDPKNSKKFADPKALKYWLGSPKQGEGGGVDWYNGGMEHTTLHLLYSRFWHKFLYDQKLVPTSEPYAKRTSHGLILAKDGEKMSKSKGNVVNPDEIVQTWGADSLRLYEMFMGPFDQAIPWSTENIIGVRRFLEKVWRLQEKVNVKNPEVSLRGMPLSETSGSALLHKTIQKVSDDIEAMRFNTAVSAMMILVNEFDKSEQISKSDFETFLKLLSPFAPHITEELWAALGHKKSIALEPWPVADTSKMAVEEATIMIQINGKVRGQVVMPLDSTEAEVLHKATEDESVKKWLAGQEVKKVVYVKNRLINIVIHTAESQP